MPLLKLPCDEEGDGKVDNSTHVRRGVGLAADIDDDARFCTVKIEVLDETVSEYVGSPSQWIV